MCQYLRNWKFPASSKKILPRLAWSNKLDQHPSPLALHISPDQKLKKSNLGQNPKITILCPQLFLLEEVRERKFDHHARVRIFFQRPTIIPTSLLTNKQNFLFLVPSFKAEHPPGFWFACDQISNIQVIQKAFRKYFSRQKLLRQREAAAGENFFLSTLIK